MLQEGFPPQATGVRRQACRRHTRRGIPPQATGEPSPVGGACPKGLGGFPAVGNWRKRKAHAKGERVACPEDSPEGRRVSTINSYIHPR